MANASILTTVATVLLVNMRHVLYGAILGPYFSKWSTPKKLISAFGLTDEVFAVTNHYIKQEVPTPVYQLTFIFSCYVSWVAGTILGGSMGRFAPVSISDILAFSLPALFLALLFNGGRSVSYFVAALCGCFTAIITTQMWGSVGYMVGAIVGATLGMVSKRGTMLN